jgi:dephospho-CoA kinase
MLKSYLKKIAVTGVLSGGKSTVCHLLKDFGAYVVSADEVVHQLLSLPSVLSRQVVELLGTEIVVKGQIERSQIAKIVFRQPALLQSLEALLHPAVRDEIAKQYEAIASTASYALFVVEIPLLFETGAEHFYDATIAVIADRELCIQRFMLTTGNSKDEFERRMARQLSADQKVASATYVIINNGSSEELATTVKEIYNTLTNSPQPQRQES